MSEVLQTSGSVLEAQKWNNVVFSYDNSTATINIFVNGNLVATKNDTVNFTAEKLQDMIIGRGFDGSIDALKIFKKPISQEEAYTLADEGMYGRTTKSTIHSLDFNNTDKNPGSFYDKSTDTVYNVKGGSATYEDGVNSSAKSVKLGSGAYISLGDSPIFNNKTLDDFSVSAWINLDESSTHTNQKIFYKEGVVDFYIDNQTPKLKLGTSATAIAFDQSPSETQGNPYIRSGMFTNLKDGGYEGDSDVLTLPKMSLNAWVKKIPDKVSSIRPQFKFYEPTPQYTNYFGMSQLSGDGNTLVIGVPMNKGDEYDHSVSPSSPNAQGTVYVYVRGDGDTWDLQKQLFSDEKAANQQYGNSVQISHDGNTMAVSEGLVPNDTVIGKGKIHIYKRVGGEWTLVQKIVPPIDLNYAHAYWSGLSMSGDGNTIIWTAPSLRNPETNSGSYGCAFVYYRDTPNDISSSFTLQQRLEPADLYATHEDDKNFGMLLDLSSDGNVAVISAHHDNHDGSAWMSGAAYVFRRDGSGAWQEEQKLLMLQRHNQFGKRVNISGDGSTIAVTAQFKRGETLDTGMVYIYKQVDGVWTEQQEVSPDEELAKYDNFGYGVALSHDGNTMLVTSEGDDEDGNDENFIGNTGSAYLFKRGAGNAYYYLSRKIVADDRSATTYGFGKSPSISADGSLGVVGSSDDHPNNNETDHLKKSGAVYVLYDLDQSHNHGVRELDPAEFNPIFMAGDRLQIGLQDDKLVTKVKPLAMKKSVYTGTRTKVADTVNAVVQGVGDKITSKARSDNVKVEFSPLTESATSSLQAIEFKTPSWKNTPAAVVVKVFSSAHPTGKVVVNEALTFRGKDYVHKFIPTEQIDESTKYSVSFTPTENGVVEVEGVQFTSVIEDTFVGSVVGTSFNTISCEGTTTADSRVYAFASVSDRSDVDNAIGSTVTGSDGTFSFVLTDNRGQLAQATGTYNVYFSVDRYESGVMMHFDDVFSAVLSYGFTWTQQRDETWGAQDVGIHQGVARINEYWYNDAKLERENLSEFNGGDTTNFTPSSTENGYLQFLNVDKYKKTYFHEQRAYVDEIRVGPLTNFNTDKGRLELLTIDENDDIIEVVSQETITATDQRITLAHIVPIQFESPVQTVRYRVRYVNPDVADETEPNKYQYLVNPDGQDKFIFNAFIAYLKHADNHEKSLDYLSIVGDKAQEHDVGQVTFPNDAVENLRIMSDVLDSNGLPNGEDTTQGPQTSASNYVNGSNFVDGQNMVRWEANAKYPPIDPSLRYGAADGRVSGLALGGVEDIKLNCMVGVYAYQSTDPAAPNSTFDYRNNGKSAIDLLNEIESRVTSTNAFELYAYPSADLELYASENNERGSFDVTYNDTIQAHFVGDALSRKVSITFTVRGYSLVWPSKHDLTRHAGEGMSLDGRFSGGRNWTVKQTYWPGGNSDLVKNPQNHNRLNDTDSSRVDDVTVKVQDTYDANYTKDYTIKITTKSRYWTAGINVRKLRGHSHGSWNMRTRVYKNGSGHAWINMGANTRTNWSGRFWYTDRITYSGTEDSWHDDNHGHWLSRHGTYASNRDIKSRYGTGQGSLHYGNKSGYIEYNFDCYGHNQRLGGSGGWHPAPPPYVPPYRAPYRAPTRRGSR